MKAISIPSVHGKRTMAEVPTTRGKRTRARPTKLSHSVNRFQSLLIQAQAVIESIFEQACVLCPSTLAQLVGLLMGEARLLSSVINEPDQDQTVLALKTIMLLGILNSKYVLIQIDQRVSITDGNKLHWSTKRNKSTFH